MWTVVELLPGIPDKQVYTLKEVATALGKSTRTIRNWIKKGDLEAFKLGNAWAIRYEDLARLLKVPIHERGIPPETPYGEYE